MGPTLTVWRHGALFFSVGLLSLSAIRPLPTLAGGPTGDRTLAERLRKGPGIVNHPVGTRPSGRVRIPKDWPLDASGELTCLTCHTRLPPPLNGTGQAYLRSAAGKTPEIGGFCAHCHDATRVGGPGSRHWLAIGYAHLVPQRASAARSGASPDTVSNNCLSCHDGVNAREVGHKWSLSVVGPLNDPGRNHPVGIPYLRRQGDGRGSSLRHASLLPSEVRLPGGKVSCVSCHNLYNVERHHLSVPIEGSRLCLTCHDMD